MYSLSISSYPSVSFQQVLNEKPASKNFKDKPRAFGVKHLRLMKWVLILSVGCGSTTKKGSDWKNEKKLLSLVPA